MPEVRQDFASFVRARTTTLLRTAFLLTGDATAAEELVQDTLVHLYPRWGRVAAADAPLAYVRRCMMNRFLNVRSGSAAREIAVESIPDRWLSDAASERLVDRDELWSLLLTLPARQRAALVLRFYHDLRDADIASALHCRAGTVRSLVSRALASLRQSMIESTDPEPRSGR